MKKIALIGMALAGCLLSTSSFAWYGGPRVGVSIGIPLGDPYYRPYDPYYTPYYAPPPVVYAPPQPVYVSPPPPPVYVQKTESVRYYCPRPKGYYPDLPSCKAGWIEVPPN